MLSPDLPSDAPGVPVSDSVISRCSPSGAAGASVVVPAGLLRHQSCLAGCLVFVTARRPAAQAVGRSSTSSAWLPRIAALRVVFAGWGRMGRLGVSRPVEFVHSLFCLYDCIARLARDTLLVSSMAPVSVVLLLGGGGLRWIMIRHIRRVCVFVCERGGGITHTHNIHTFVERTVSSENWSITMAVRCCRIRSTCM